MNYSLSKKMFLWSITALLSLQSTGLLSMNTGNNNPVSAEISVAQRDHASQALAAEYIRALSNLKPELLVESSAHSAVALQESMLLEAATRGDTFFIKELLAKKPGINSFATDKAGNNIYDLTCKHGHRELKEYIESQPEFAHIVKIHKSLVLEKVKLLSASQGASKEMSTAAAHIAEPTYEDFQMIVSGIDREKIEQLLTHPFKTNTLLLHGPKGTGKSLTVSTLGKMLQVPVIALSSSKFAHSDQNVCVSKIQNTFEEIEQKITPGQKVIFAIDNIDAIAGKNISNNELALKALVDSIENMKRESNKAGKHILFAATTQKYNVLDESFLENMAIRIETSLPQEKDRALILHKLLRENDSEPALINHIASKTECFSVEHLEELANKIFAAKSKKHPFSLSQADSLIDSMRKTYSSLAPKIIPPIYNPIVGKERHATKKVGEIQPGILDMLENPLSHRKVLLHGPSGTGKSSEADALAFAFDAKLLSCNAANLVKPHQGTGALGVNELFEQAMLLADKGKKTVILIDEIDLIAADKLDLDNSKERIAAGHALSEKLDFLDKDAGTYKNNITFIAATNYPQKLDQHLRNRMHSIEIPLPNGVTREALIQKTLLEKNMSCDPKTISWLGGKTENFSARNLENLINSAVTSQARSNEKSSLLSKKQIESHFAAEKKEVDSLQEKRELHVKAEENRKEEIARGSGTNWGKLVKEQSVITTIGLGLAGLAYGAGKLAVIVKNRYSNP